MSEQRQLCFVAEDENVHPYTSAITGGIEATLNYVRSYLENMENGETREFVLTRRDMSQTELDAAPVV